MKAVPNRLHAFYGAAKAAEAAGNEEKARGYFAKLAALGRDADPERAEVREAREHLVAKN